MHPTAVTAVGCCRAPMPTTEDAVVRIGGDVPQLWQLCLHRRRNRFFMKLKTKFAHNQDFSKLRAHLWTDVRYECNGYHDIT